MENDEILQQIALDIHYSGWLDTECRKICKDKNLSNELRQEIYLIILTFKEDGNLQLAFSRGEHLPFIKRIIMNQFNSKTSPFYTKFKKFTANKKLVLDLENIPE